ncbi:MAG: TolC family protein [Carboxylicivirga sp.]|nr:TolC family protein [Carboxylicivirga sp.]
MTKQSIFSPFIWGLGLILISQSCLVSKNYERPDDLPIADTYRTEAAAAFMDSITLLSWQQYFKDPVLIDHIKTALDNNRDYAMATNQLLRANALVKQSKAALLPGISVNANAQNTLEGEQSDNYLLNGSISWEADLWGKIRSNKRASVAAYMSSQTNVEAYQALIVTQVAGIYIQLMALDEQYALTKQTLALRENHVKTMRALKGAGMTNEAGVQQSIAQQLATESLLYSLENSILLSENAMSLLLGLNPDKIQRSALSSFEIEEVGAVGVPADLLINRPDVKAAELNLIQAFELTNVAKAQFYPSVTLSANGGYNALKLSEWVKPDAAFFNVAASLVQPVLNKRQIRTNYEISQLNQQDALLQYEQSLINAGKEVSDALFNIRLNNRQLSVKEKQLNAQKSALKASNHLLENGMVNYLEVLLAQEGVLNSQLAIINEQTQLLSN